MKTIKIGRGNDCQIFLEDAKISRNHALLKIDSFGKMEIVDMSSNGTFVNGLKVPQGKPYPVSRKDVVSFAGTETLNWALVPNPMKYVVWAAVAVAVIAAIVIAFSAFNALSPEPEFYEDAAPASVSTPSGSKEKAEDAEGQKEKTSGFFSSKPSEKKGTTPKPVQVGSPGKTNESGAKTSERKEEKEEAPKTENPQTEDSKKRGSDKKPIVL